jgi:hypothetical protein
MGRDRLPPPVVKALLAKDAEAEVGQEAGQQKGTYQDEYQRQPGPANSM